VATKKATANAMKTMSFMGIPRMARFLEPLRLEQGVKQVGEQSGGDEQAQPGHEVRPAFGVVGNVMGYMRGSASVK
jgi:hypothetical protein